MNLSRGLDQVLQVSPERFHRSHYCCTRTRRNQNASLPGQEIAQ